MRFSNGLLACVFVAGAGACSVTEVSPLASGVYPCESADECPPEQSCVVGQCWVEAAPLVEVIAPERETAFAITSPDEPVPVVVKVTGQNLALVDPGTDPDAEFGKGNVVVYVDDEEVAVLTQGEIETGVSFEVPVPPVPGAHRIRAVARMSNNVLYDNPTAEGRQFFWLDDGEPHVGFVRPFPNDVFPLEATRIDFEVAALNFSFEQAQPGAIPDNSPVGHAHVHYDQDFPACVFDNVCDNSYVGVVAPEGPATSASDRLQIPASAAGLAELTAVLRKVNHFKYLHPDEDGEPIWEDIIVRREDIGPLEEEAGDTDTDGG